MYTLTVFVPEYVNVDTIDKCFRDKKSSFEHVDSATFDAAAQQALHRKFLFLEKEHFLVHINEGEPFKCHYQSRNSIMACISLGCGPRTFDGIFKEVNGLRMAEQKPIHYFVCSDSSDSLNLDNSTESNTIVEYFDSEEDVDLAKLADIVKSKPYCVQKHFIVYNGTEYCAVETDNVENTYIFSLKHRSSIVPKLTAGTATIDAFIEYDKHMEDMAKKLETQPGFKLRDSNGKVIPDGKEFAIQILSDPEDELDEDTEGVSEEMLLFHNKYWICNYVDYGDGRVNIFCGQPHEGDTFECETINNIVYLKHDGEYLFFDADDKRSLLYFSNKVPTKEQRIQIHFDDNGDIWFTNWDGSTSVTCEEVKYPYSMIGLCENNIPTKFRLVSL